jgi:hypothetical protein
MTKKYISDIITIDEIEKWEPGNRILIESQTGSGKSEFVKNNLYEYAKLNNKKILLMSNRNLLKNQNLEEIGNKSDNIKAHNYQEFEARVLHGLDLQELFEPYDYIVYDECHYFYSDSSFNKNTDILISPIKDTPKDKIFLFITATPQALLDYQRNYDFRYKLSYDYSYIKNIYFYNRPKNTLPIVESIIRTIPENEKILYFGSSAKDNLRLAKLVENSSFICSSGNELYEESENSTIEEIVKLSKFNKRVLFSTKLLDNGVNIKDESLKHIFLDMSDIVTFLQCLGRKRVLNENDTISLYVRNYNIGNLYYIKKGYEDKIKNTKAFERGELDEFEDLWAIQKKTGDLINKNYEINISKYQHYKTQYKILGKIFEDKTELKYKRYICKLLNFDIDKIQNANMVYEKFSIADLLDKYTGVKMFDEDMETFKVLLFNNIFTPKKTDYGARGIKAANGILKEDGLNFKIYSRRETGGFHRREYYWIVERLEMLEGEE